MVKIIANYSTGEEITGYHLCGGQKRFAVMNEQFLGNERRFLKSDDNQVAGMVDRIKENPKDIAFLNYLSNHNTMTLMDSVSYDKKQNETNGEHNRDGSDYNFSWNCGVEGPSRKKKIVELRRQQIKNGITMLFMSQATPMIYAGDEMGKSCKGNNNPYCQDNELSWINWNDLKTNEEIFQYTKELIAFRKAHRLLHQKMEPKLMDYKSLGCPDLSFHGEQPWKVDTSYNSRSFAFMYNGAYDKPGEEDIYVAFNMNWDRRKFAIPYIDKKKKWTVAFSTDKNITTVEKPDRMISLDPRTVCVLVSEG
jgi:glycogen operon protein